MPPMPPPIFSPPRRPPGIRMRPPPMPRRSSTLRLRRAFLQRISHPPELFVTSRTHGTARREMGARLCHVDRSPNRPPAAHAHSCTGRTRRACALPPDRQPRAHRRRAPRRRSDARAGRRAGGERRGPGGAVDHAGALAARQVALRRRGRPVRLLRPAPLLRARARRGGPRRARRLARAREAGRGRRVRTRLLHRRCRQGAPAAPVRRPARARAGVRPADRRARAPRGRGRHSHGALLRPLPRARAQLQRQPAAGAPPRRPRLPPELRRGGDVRARQAPAHARRGPSARGRSCSRPTPRTRATRGTRGGRTSRPGSWTSGAPWRRFATRTPRRSPARRRPTRSRCSACRCRSPRARAGQSPPEPPDRSSVRAVHGTPFGPGPGPAPGEPGRYCNHRSVARTPALPSGVPCPRARLPSPPP